MSRPFTCVLAASLLLLSVPAFAGDKAGASAPPPPPPEVAATVNAFAGTWMLDCAVTPPGAPAPIKFKSSIKCDKVAGARGVSCAMAAKVPGLGTMEELDVIAYEIGTKITHVYGVTSDGAVHDHHCSWKDAKTLACEPLKGFIGTDEITEDVSFSWADAKSMMFKATITAKDGSKLTFEGMGKRK